MSCAMDTQVDNSLMPRFKSLRIKDLDDTKEVSSDGQILSTPLSNVSSVSDWASTYVPKSAADVNFVYEGAVTPRSLPHLEENNGSNTKLKLKPPRRRVVKFQTDYEEGAAQDLEQDKTRHVGNPKLSSCPVIVTDEENAASLVAKAPSLKKGSHLPPLTISDSCLKTHLFPDSSLETHLTPTSPRVVSPRHLPRSPGDKQGTVFGNAETARKSPLLKSPSISLSTVANIILNSTRRKSRKSPTEGILIGNRGRVSRRNVPVRRLSLTSKTGVSCFHLERLELWYELCCHW